MTQPPIATTHNRRCPRCPYNGPGFTYVPHATSADGKFTEQDYWRCPECGAKSTGLDKRQRRAR